MNYAYLGLQRKTYFFDLNRAKTQMLQTDLNLTILSVRSVFGLESSANQAPQQPIFTNYLHSDREASN